MAWTAPMTAVASTAFTAAQFNAHVRDNLLETAPGKATTAGRIFVATGANVIAERSIGAASVSTSETTASTSYTDLTTPGPATTLDTGTLVIAAMTSNMANNTLGSSCFASIGVTGASSITAIDDYAASYESSAANDNIRCAAIQFISGLTAGSNTFTAKYRVDGGTGTFKFRRITIFPVGG